MSFGGYIEVVKHVRSGGGPSCASRGLLLVPVDLSQPVAMPGCRSYREGQGKLHLSMSPDMDCVEPCGK